MAFVNSDGRNCDALPFPGVIERTVLWISCGPEVQLPRVFHRCCPVRARSSRVRAGSKAQSDQLTPGRTPPSLNVSPVLHHADIIIDNRQAVAAGITNENLDPWARVDSTSTCAPNNLTLRSTIDRPRPRPACRPAGSFSTR